MSFKIRCAIYNESVTNISSSQPVLLLITIGETMVLINLTANNY